MQYNSALVHLQYITVQFSTSIFAAQYWTFTAHFRWPAHLQHITVQFSTSTLAVHYIKIQYQHICSTFQVTCTFAAHKDGDTRSYFIPLIGLFAVFRTITAQLQHICCTNTAHLQHQYISAQLQHNYSTIEAQLQHISAQLQHIVRIISDQVRTKVWTS